MAAKVPLTGNGQVIRIDSPREEHGHKAVIQLKLNGGTATLTPTAILKDTADLAAADGVSIEYNTPAASGTKLTAAITAAGIYEFFLDGKSLLLTVSNFGGTPVLYYGTLPV